MRHDALKHRLIRASAGTGKTHQLTNHYIGLLAAGVSPDAILATTFTRKAAGEILDRVLERLAKAAGDDKEAGELSKQMGAAFASSDFAALLVKLLHNLHRVRISTLDAVFQSVARMFAFELGLPPAWSICDEHDDQRLRRDAVERVLEQESEAVLVSLCQRLNYGNMKRAVQTELIRVVTSLHEVYQDSPAEAWNRLTVPLALFHSDLDDLLHCIEAFDLSNDSRMENARDKDVENARAEEWDRLLAVGLCGKDTYNKKPVPDELAAMYRKLDQHLASVIVQKLVARTLATREFLECFDREFRALQQSSGSLRFEDVTQALSAVMRDARTAASLAYRMSGTIDHLLLDEFQDTSVSQWRVLEPLARAVIDQPSRRTFFCVGDVKQAIYGWRGGFLRVFDSVGSLGPMEQTPLNTSRRSAQPIIDAVNSVFGNLVQVDSEKCRAALDTWQKRFTPHTTVKDFSGYVALHTGPALKNGEGPTGQLGRHCAYVAEKVRELTLDTPKGTFGVLCSTKATLARMAYELRERGVVVSEEADNPLTDSAAVELMLSLFTLADHPAHRVAAFHVRNSPFRERLATWTENAELSEYLRSEVLRLGYGPFAQEWASLLVGACDQREVSKLDRLVAVAYDYQRRSTLRAIDFVDWVRAQRLAEPTDARVRVMTIHGAKGLEFDVVVLPELAVELVRRWPKFVVRRRPDTFETNFVSCYVKQDYQRLLGAEDRQTCEEWQREDMEESLSVLYVAMTRAARALHMFMPGPRKNEIKDRWCTILRQTLAGDKTLVENATIYHHGIENWCESKKTAADKETPVGSKAIVFPPGGPSRRRGLELVAPSHREGGARIALGRLFNREERFRTALGTLYHAWFATVEWLDDGIPSESRLKQTAQALRAQLPSPLWQELDRLIADFRQQCQGRAIASLLSRHAYTSPDGEGFPSRLRTVWRSGLAVQRVERERRLAVRDDNTILNGSADRLVWLGTGQGVVAVDIIDFKTDQIALLSPAALAERVAFYKPQMDSYRQAVSRLARLPLDRISARLAFTSIAQVAEL